MSSDQVRVIVGVGEHCLLGSLPLTGNRIQELLNDSNSDFLKLSDVEVHSSTKRGCLAILPEAVVPKSKIEFVARSSHEHEAKDKQWNNRVSKNVCKTFVTLSNYCVSGELHLLTATSDAAHALSNQLGRFFAVTEATVSGHGITQLDVSLFIVNKDFVSCLHLGDAADARNPCVVPTSSDLRVGDADDENVEIILDNLDALLGHSTAAPEIKADSSVS